MNDVHVSHSEANARVSSPIIEATPADTDVVLSFGKIISTSLSMTLEQNVIALGRALENNGSVDILVTTMNICGSRRAFPRRLYRRRALIESLFSSVKRKLSARNRAENNHEAAARVSVLALQLVGPERSSAHLARF